MDELFKPDNLKKFWPTKKQEPKERVLATMRFVIYLSVILFIIKQDKRIIILGMGILFVLYMMYSNGMVKKYSETYRSAGEPTATADNFMDNTLMANYPMGPNTGVPTNSDEEWKKIHPFLEGSHWSQMNFFKMPNNNLNEFTRGAYEPMFKPTCRDDNEVCDQTTRPDWIQSRGPARTNNGLY
jgi:hypothetical protein